jgi:hypothetical protein
MICVSIARLVGCLTAMTAVFPASAADSSFSAPFQILFEDGTGGIGWGLNGGQPSVRFEVDATGPIIRKGYVPFISLWSVADGKSMFQWLADSVKSPTPVEKNIRMLTSAREATTKICRDTRIVGARFPGCDIDAKDARGVEIAFEQREGDRLLGHELAHVIQQAGKRQKMWQSSAFRLRVADWPTERVSKIESFTIKQGVSPSGAPTWDVSDLEFEIPNADRIWPDQEMVKALDGNPSLLVVQLDYLDPNGNPLLTLRTTYEIKSVGMANPFADPNDPDEPVKVTLRKKKITLETKEGDIDIFCN